MTSDGDDGTQQMQELQITGDSTTKSGSMSVEEALQSVLKKSHCHGGLVRGAKECARTLDRYFSILKIW